MGLAAAAARGALALALTAGLAACRDRESPTKPPPAPAESAPSSAVAPDHPALIFLGDSLTAGYGLAATESVPALIQAEVDRAGLAFRVVNAGRSGDTTAGGVARIDYYLRPEVRPRGLIIWLGANDAMRGIPTTEIETNLRTIVQRAHTFDVSMPVLLVEMKAFPNLGPDYAKAFEAIYPRIAESENAGLLPFPLEGVAGHPDLNQADGIHPTAEGTRKVAATLWLSLRRHLGAR